ncbi:hypothetical protein [Arthrobacter bambusae]|uniref:hypothetical protein n=1 Tax=Arthrobacter bambusae TaxID=1338426 RepID=UPI00277DB731|nr:hypothetical protein [Arthrobacter bambusae]MDQ0210904.1 hypothetical protein [Arthrobacter bambusae]MDQ0236029.1 hypothetical protein [Arthrobacter bambusae]
MGFDPHEPQQQRMLAAALKSARVSVGELWLKYFSLGGEVGEYEVEAYLQGLLSLPVLQRDLLAMAANELIDKFPQGHAPYSDELGPDGESPRKEPGSGSQQRPESED